MGRDERGLSESVQWTLITPLVLLIVMGIIQLGLWGYGRTVVHHAASAAAEAAAPLTASAADGSVVGTAIAERAGMTAVSVSVSEDATSVVARVSGRVQGTVDLGISGVSAEVSRPKERVTSP